jgi:LacI family transcriptional regulator
MAHARGYSLILCDSSESHRKKADHLALLMSHRAVGIVYAPRRGMGAYWEYQSLVASGTPVVVISADPHDLPCTHVRTDDVRAGYIAVRHLLDLGRQRIMLVCTCELPPPQTTPTVDAAIRDRLVGARLALREAGLPDSGTRVILAPPMMEGGLAAGTALLASSRPLPDGVFVTTDTVALGMIEALSAPVY